MGDCTIRAICAVTGRSWYSVHDELCDLSRQMSDMPSADRVWWEMLRRHGFRQVKLPDRCPECYTVAEFCRDHPRGMYVLGPNEHAVAVVNGEYWDSWDSGRTVPTYIFRR